MVTVRITRLTVACPLRSDPLDRRLHAGMEDLKYNESWSPAEYAAQAGTEDQSTPVSGDGSALYAAPGPPTAPQAGAAEQSLPRDGRDGGRGGGRGGESRNRSRH